jgi:hypothetical protein
MKSLRIGNVHSYLRGNGFKAHSKLKITISGEVLRGAEGRKQYGTQDRRCQRKRPDHQLLLEESPFLA